MDTPKTDAVAVYSGDIGDEVVTADFARTLERDLAAANARVAELEGANIDQQHRLEELEGSHCGGDCISSPCGMCDGTQRQGGTLQRLQEVNAELTQQVNDATARAESAESRLATAEADALRRAAEVCDAKAKEAAQIWRDFLERPCRQGESATSWHQHYEVCRDAILALIPKEAK